MNKNGTVKVDKIITLNSDGPTKAFCDLMLFDIFKVRGVRIVEGQNGLFVSMPQEKGKDGKWYSIFYPISKELKKGLDELILSEYKEKDANLAEVQ